MRVVAAREPLPEPKLQKSPLSAPTFPRLLLEHAARRPDACALREKKFGIWQTLGWRDLADLVHALAGGLAAAGLCRGQHVAVIGANRPRLYATLLAVQSLGAVAVPLYQDAAADELVFPLANAEVAFAVVEDQEQVDKLLALGERCPALAHVWYDEPRGLRHYQAPGLASLDALAEAGRAFNALHPAHVAAQLEAGDPQDTAAVFYTSGTTGQPKGVMHSHHALIDRSRAGQRFDALTAAEEVLAYLPPAWIGQNIFSYAQWLVCGYVVNCPESAETVQIDLGEIGPTYYFAPPRVFENLLTRLSIRMQDAGFTQRWLFEHFMALAQRVGPAVLAARRGGPAVPLAERLHYALGDLCIYGPLRNRLGFSRVRVAYTAGEAIGPDLFRFFRAIGVNLKQLYGSTETGVFVCIQPDREARADSVGVPVDGVEVKVAEGGEIWVRSPGLLQGYYKNAAATAEVLTPDGWFRTGDAGFLDQGGHLMIIDRAKDVGRLRGGAHDGALFAPKYVENKLKFFPYIKEAVAFGDGRERVCAFINIDANAVGSWAERHDLPYGGYADLAAKPAVQELVRDCVERANAELASDATLAGSQVSRFLVLHKELDADDGELTRTNKVKRGHIADKYRVLVEALYAGRSSQYIETAVSFEDGRRGVVSAELAILDAKVFAPHPRPAA